MNDELKKLRDELASNYMPESGWTSQAVVHGFEAAVEAMQARFIEIEGLRGKEIQTVIVNEDKMMSLEIEKLRSQIEGLVEALTTISDNSRCYTYPQAKLVALKALEKNQGLEKQEA